MGHVYPDSSADPVDIVAWWAEQASREVEDAEDSDGAALEAIKARNEAVRNNPARAWRARRGGDR